MAFLPNVDSIWRSRMTTVAEIWHVRAGAALVSTEAQAGDADGGIQLPVGGTREFGAGVTVYYRSEKAEPTRLWYEPR